MMLSSLVDKVQSSTSSLASSMSAASEEVSPKLEEQMRRLSMPLGRVRKLSGMSARRLSQMISTIGETIDQEILMNGW